ncbi:hypothetical protein Tbd_1450 [Thiobacillus denitrificans ATCC 25259]|uniref:Phosphatidate cytidylyltransferase n=1 Tax=Thiobacillus denitrificans (strain ATCC 25259 / T1) TaxID=292415 RepID=Q3SIX2_THIDA|nr:hypothetical protein [Thiobacillus denitrificans]AAZ97403.1 hypothetical protein Tbd_1450 [Thiobacillus denitrificans ATCC 25259]
MLRNTRTRRALAVALIVAGGALLYLAPEAWAGGVVVLALGVLLELAGVVLERRS